MARTQKVRADDSRVDLDLRVRYETFRSLLGRNHRALRHLADLEADLNHVEPSDERLLVTIRPLVRECLLMVQELDVLTGTGHRSLLGAVRRIDAGILRAFEHQGDGQDPSLAVRLSAASAGDRRSLGGKAAGLIRLRRRFDDLVPDGFVVTAAAYRMFIEHNDLFDGIRMLLDDIECVTDPDLFRSRTAAIRNMILGSPVPGPVGDEIDRLAAGIGAGPSGWAVRSSARSEDEVFSFAGQFETVLGVAPRDLRDAYRQVLAGRFTDRAVRYRITCGFREVETPMAVLFMPMVEARAAGVIYTRNPEDPRAGEMLLSAVPGLADALVRGDAEGEGWVLARDREAAPIRRTDARSGAGCLSDVDLCRVGRAALAAAQAMGGELDIEWALDREDHLWFLQARELGLERSGGRAVEAGGRGQPLIERGVTVASGRAEGSVEFASSTGSLVLESEAPVLVTDRSGVALSALAPRIAALLVKEGSPVSHLATVLRELSVPSVFRLGPAIHLLPRGELVSVDASMRRVYRGSRWPGIRRRVLDRVDAGKRREGPQGVLHDLVLALNLTDPYGSRFGARDCRSLHDVVRFVHEMSIRSMFSLGDSRNRPWRRTASKLVSDVPVRLRVIVLDEDARSRRGRLRPEDVDSVPFQALWKGMTDPAVRWSRRAMGDLDWMPSDFVEQVLGGTRGPRRKLDSNYAMVSREYLNLNARLVFHYLMVDSVVGPGRDGNHVHFRARGGGARGPNRERRARFLELVLRNLDFVVDRRVDLVTAWLRGYPRLDCERALGHIGRLMACSRQLDLLMAGDSSVGTFVDHFMAGNFSAFS